METFRPVVHGRRSTAIGAGLPIGNDKLNQISLMLAFRALDSLGAIA
jgi:hypothetical protein